MNIKSHSITLALLLVATAAVAFAQQSTVYTTVVATRLFVVGAPNPRTGLHFQTTPGDSLWEHTGPKTVRAFHLAHFEPSRGRIIYIAAGNGLHRTADGGERWRITTDWKITELLWVSPDQTDSSLVYVGTPYGVFRTSDGCQTWQAKNKGLDQLFVSSVIIDRSSPRKLYAATEGGLYVSDDRGEEWKRMSLSVGGIRAIAQHPRDHRVLMVGTEDYGIYVSRDAGNVWERAEAGVDHKTFYTIAFDPVAPDTVYAGGYVTGVYKSTDQGRSWKRMNNGLTVLNIHSIAVDPLENSRIYAAAYWGGIYTSADGARSWKNIGLSDSQTWTVLVEPF